MGLFMKISLSVLLSIVCILDSFGSTTLMHLDSDQTLDTIHQNAHSYKIDLSTGGMTELVLGSFWLESKVFGDQNSDGRTELRLLFKNDDGESMELLIIASGIRGVTVYRLDELKYSNFHILPENIDQTKSLLSIRDNAIVSFELENVGADNNQENIFELYPNPASEKITIKLLKEIDESRQVTLELVDIRGTILKSYQIQNPQTDIDVSELPSGVYLFAMKTNNKIYEQKLVVRR